jgi:hypothetical protein
MYGRCCKIREDLSGHELSNLDDAGESRLATFSRQRLEHCTPSKAVKACERMRPVNC